MIPLSRPPVDDEIKRAVLAAIDSRHYILGPECRALEAELAAHTGVAHAVLTSSGTAALWLIFRALGLAPGDEVLVPAHTAFPTVEAICAAGGTPVFVDVDEWYTLDVKEAAARLTPRTVGVVAVHLYGQPADLPALQDLAARHGLWLVEDCAQAQGAAWDGRRVGAFGRAAALSFYPSKNLPALGDGGAVLTADDGLAERCRRLRDHGRLSKDRHAEVGFNLRFNEVQAAALRVLLRRLDAMNEHRRALAARYAAGLEGLPLGRPAEREHARHVYHLYVVRAAARDALAGFLAERGIQTGIHYPIPAHR
ncbi:MAG TPA: DegT/DnrJ/EryC1/StrS family aminotransferase, partial [Candidatus Binatia bacterium]|nr:DegT/DnrJ/EryC1/StrS family aminotransferase [Candidatus Binatia bacterium]